MSCHCCIIILTCETWAMVTCIGWVTSTLTPSICIIHAYSAHRRTDKHVIMPPSLVTNYPSIYYLHSLLIALSAHFTYNPSFNLQDSNTDIHEHSSRDYLWCIPVHMTMTSLVTAQELFTWDDVLSVTKLGTSMRSKQVSYSWYQYLMDPLLSGQSAGSTNHMYE